MLGFRPFFWGGGVLIMSLRQISHIWSSQLLLSVQMPHPHAVKPFCQWQSTLKLEVFVSQLISDI